MKKSMGFHNNSDFSANMIVWFFTYKTKVIMFVHNLVFC
jgi:hypothetical protein